MARTKLRQQIAWEAARLLFQQLESEYYPAKIKAAALIQPGELPPSALPTNNEIRHRIRKLALRAEPPSPPPSLRLSMAADCQEDTDPLVVFESLLLPLESVQQNLKYHPEGDALYHSLQVFDLARHELPYDEEFLLAALLHDVGKAIDPSDHVAAGLAALEGLITDRTAWLIANHSQAHALADQTLGRRAHRRLRESESYDDLLLLAKCDRQGRQPGAQAPELDEALDYLRSLGEMYA